MLLSYLTANISIADAKPCSLLKNEILNLGCKLINVYSELRQVNTPLFALCKAVRFHISTNNSIMDEYKMFLSSSSSSQLCLKAAKALLCSQDLLLTIANAIKSVPEGQAGNCIQQLNLDIADTLEWIRQNSFFVDRELLNEDKATRGHTLDMNIPAEVMGRILSEIYATVLESVSITATNSISIGNSLKNLIKTLRPSLGCFLQTQSVNVNDIFFSITGRKVSNIEFMESENNSQVILQTICWLFLSFFRLYASSRSLCKQSISLMPPDLSYKASKSLGELFTASCCLDWVRKPEKMDGGYFSWIDSSSISLPEAIKKISKVFISSSFAAYAPLVYILQLITLQRLRDLSRLIKAFEFCHKSAEMQMQNDTNARPSIKAWKKLIAGSRNEAVELTNLMTGHLALLDLKGKFGKFDGGGKCSPEYEGEWDRCVWSLDEKSLHVAVWWLLCQNSDVWCIHSTKKNLKKFVSYLFLYSLPCLSDNREVMERSMNRSSCNTVTLHSISLAQLQDTISYEQMMTHTNVSSRFFRILKKLVCPVLQIPTNNLDLGSPPNWVEIFNILEKGPIRISTNDGLDLYDGSSLSGLHLEHRLKPPSSSFSLELKACENLFNLFCKMPKFHENVKSFSGYATYMLNIERFLLPNLLNHHDESFKYDSFELLRLFVSCRRAMKYLLMGSTEKSGVVVLRAICAAFDCSSSILWLLKSAYKIAGLPNEFFGKRDSIIVQEMIYSLIDHTSYVLLKISEAKANTTLLFLAKEAAKNDPKPQIDNDDSFHIFFQPCDDWVHVEELADTFKELAEKFLVTFKSSVYSAKINVFSNSPDWNKFSTVISGFQALLLGITSASDSMFKEINLEIWKKSSFMLYCASKLSDHITVFEDLVNLCLRMTVLDDSQVIESVISAKVDPSVFDDIEKTVNFHAPINTAKFSCHSTEHMKNNDAILGEEIESFQPVSDSESGKKKSKASTIKKRSSAASRIKLAIDFFTIVNKIDLQKFKIFCESLLQCLLNDPSPQVCFILKQLFITSATILRIKIMLSCDKHWEGQSFSDRSLLSSVVILFGTSYIILQELSEIIDHQCWFFFAWLDGLLTFLDIVGSLFTFVDPDISKDIYTNLIELHMKAMGKCISLQGKAATLSCHDTRSVTTMYEAINEKSRNLLRSFEHGKYSFGAFKTKLRMSMKKCIMIPSLMHLKLAIQVIERKLVGVRSNYPAIYQLNTGNLDGGLVFSDFAASIECFELILECFSGHNKFLKKNMPNFVGDIVSIIFHLQKPSIFYVEKFCLDRSKIDADAGAVILMCVEVLTEVVGRRSFHMDSCYVSQYFHIPMVLFSGFHKLRVHSTKFSCNEENSSLVGSQRQLYIVDRQFSVELYTSCCRLMCSTIKHQKSEAERSIHLIEESLSTLLSCLEAADSDTAKREGYFSWELGEAIKCASFFRRIYEEIRHQKDALKKYAFLLLSNYISTFSGCGPSKAGIRREIDETLRPGVYSLIDICTRDDLQQLHSLLSEGPCRSTLAILLQDYKQNFQYEGKI